MEGGENKRDGLGEEEVSWGEGEEETKEIIKRFMARSEVQMLPSLCRDKL
jgi:hypothetical protein